MKKLLLWWHGIRSSLLSSIVLFLAITMTLYTFSDACAIYRYDSIAYEKFSAAFEGRGVFFGDVSTVNSFDVQYTIEDVQERLDLIKSLRENPVVADVYTGADLSAVPEDRKNGSVIVHCYSSSMLELFPVLSVGKWFDEPINSDGSINTVLCGTEYWNVPVGSDILADVDGKEVRFRVCGILYSPTLFPRFGGYSSKMYLKMLYTENANAFIVGECDETVRMVMESPSTSIHGTAYNYFLLEFDPKAPEAEIEAVLESLSARGGYQDVSAILKTSREHLKTSFLNNMMTPLFFLAISFIVYFSLSILSVRKRLYSYSVYYLLGYSRARIIWATVCRVGLILIPAVVLNVLYTCSYRSLVMKGMIEVEINDVKLYFDSLSPWFVIGAAAFLFVITLAACLALLHKKSPADVWRRSKE